MQRWEEMAEDLEEETEAILPIYRLAMEFAPEYDGDKIYIKGQSLNIFSQTE